MASLRMCVLDRARHAAQKSGQNAYLLIVLNGVVHRLAMSLHLWDYAPDALEVAASLLRALATACTHLRGCEIWPEFAHRSTLALC